MTGELVGPMARDRVEGEASVRSLAVGLLLGVAAWAAMVTAVVLAVGAVLH